MEYASPMNSTVIMFFFFATAPVALMPSIISLLTRHRSRWIIVAINLALWTLILFAARSFSIGTSERFQVPVLVALAAWLVLLGFSIRSQGRQPAVHGMTGP